MIQRAALWMFGIQVSKQISKRGKICEHLGIKQWSCNKARMPFDVWPESFGRHQVLSLTNSFHKFRVRSTVRYLLATPLLLNLLDVAPELRSGGNCCWWSTLGSCFGSSDFNAIASNWNTGTPPHFDNLFEVVVLLIFYIKILKIWRFWWTDYFHAKMP